MTVANVVMFEFDTPEELKGWAQQYGKSGPFPNCLAPYIRPLIFGFSNRVSGAGGRMFNA